jgi:3-hydroxymyristoyl/3-hydroxydecanoyl-(acyl carrier protein) dehydratase
MADTKTSSSKLLYAEIIDSDISENSVTLTLHVKDNLCYFAGHFPSFPILPGVVQINWAVNYLHEFFQQQAQILRIDRLKFTCPIQPNMHIKLSLTQDPNQSFVHFHYYSLSTAPISFSQGRLVYA